MNEENLALVSSVYEGNEICSICLGPTADKKFNFCCGNVVAHESCMINSLQQNGMYKCYLCNKQINKEIFIKTYKCNMSKFNKYTSTTMFFVILACSLSLNAYTLIDFNKNEYMPTDTKFRIFYGICGVVYILFKIIWALFIYKIYKHDDGYYRIVSHKININLFIPRARTLTKNKFVSKLLLCTPVIFGFTNDLAYIKHNSITNFYVHFCIFSVMLFFVIIYPYYYYILLYFTFEYNKTVDLSVHPNFFELLGDEELRTKCEICGKLISNMQMYKLNNEFCDANHMYHKECLNNSLLFDNPNNLFCATIYNHVCKKQFSTKESIISTSATQNLYLHISTLILIINYCYIHYILFYIFLKNNMNLGKVFLLLLYVVTYNLCMHWLFMDGRNIRQKNRILILNLIFAMCNIFLPNTTWWFYLYIFPQTTIVIPYFLCGLLKLITYYIFDSIVSAGMFVRKCCADETIHGIKEEFKTQV